jgi:hypothetical protein
MLWASVWRVSSEPSLAQLSGDVHASVEKRDQVTIEHLMCPQEEWYDSRGF